MQTPILQDALALIVAELERLGVKYCISGSLAGAFYGACRSLAEVELVVILSPSHLPSLASALRDKYWLDEPAAADAIAKKSCFSMIYLPTGLKLVVYAAKDRPYDRAAMERIRLDSFDDDPASPRFYLSSPEDVVLGKLEWFRLGDELPKRQWNDAIAILKIAGDSLDRRYLVKWAMHLAVPDLLAKAWKEVEAFGP